MLYIADEVFFTGTAAEITPVRSIDKIQVGIGKMGPVARALYKEFFGIVEGRQPDRYKWFTQVPVKAKQPVGV
jgi:branched-chain amino acid aminotransferase